MKLSAITLSGIGIAAVSAAAMFRKHPPPARFRGKVVLITGGSRGLGLALAREFGRHGAIIAICARSLDQLERAQRILASEGIEATAFPCDVSSVAAVHELVLSVRERYGRIDVLVNNAGEILVGPVTTMTGEDFIQAMETMFYGPMHTIFAVLPEMQNRGSGTIVNIASIGGKVSIPHLIPYCCAKFALMALSEGLRAELGRTGISITTAVPGLMRTGSHVNARFRGDAEAEAAWFSVAASLPILAMDAGRAASQIVRAAASGKPEIVLTPQAEILARVNGALPGVIPDLLSLINLWLPEALAAPREARGMDLMPFKSRILRLLTESGRIAGEHLNQAPVK